MRLHLLALLLLPAVAEAEQSTPPLVLHEDLVQEEQRRIRLVAEAARSTIAIFEATATNGGSGVIISPDGFAVTNYHVVQPCGPGMTCALSDGRLREAVLVGLDPTGDIALIKLLGEGPFPAARIGDSDTVRLGDEAVVSGNPFLLAGDFTPTITHGIVSGVHRYQYPSGSILEYADCLQTDAAINPGNSGGPLFDDEGRLIGINGRGSFEKRGRVNVGIGYAVSINQVMAFVSHLRCGRVVDHGSLGATVITRSGPRAIVDAIETDSDAYRRGLRPGDEIVSYGERDITSANDLLNAVARWPEGWLADLTFRREEKLIGAPVRLGPLHSSGELLRAIEQGQPPQDPPAGAPEAWRNRFERHPDYANFHFSRHETDKLRARLPEAWAAGLFEDLVASKRVTIELNQQGGVWLSDRGRFRFDAGRDPSDQLAPPGAPGLMAGLWVWQALAIESGESKPRLVDDAFAFGRLPWVAGGEPLEVLRAFQGGLRVDFYFEDDRGLIGFEAYPDESRDPTRVQLTPEASDRRVKITVGDRLFAELRPAAGEPGGESP